MLGPSCGDYCSDDRKGDRNLLSPPHEDMGGGGCLNARRRARPGTRPCRQPHLTLAATRAVVEAGLWYLLQQSPGWVRSWECGPGLLGARGLSEYRVTGDTFKATQCWAPLVTAGLSRMRAHLVQS